MTPPNQRLVLVVDDEPPVRHVAEAILSNAGYRVLTASDGPEALRCAQISSPDLDLLLTDLEMPRMDGLTLASLVREICPTIRILLMSGYSHRLGQAKASGWPFLAKPFTMEALLRSVDAALGGEPELESRAG